MQSKRAVFQLAISEAELHLGNTLMNGQCFNWWKRDTNDYAGIYSKTSPSEVNIQVEPNPADIETFKKQFLDEYLQTSLKVEDLYADWSERDPTYFAKIAKPLEGMRCLRQDPWECTLSFRCSQNNHIKRITQLVAAIRNNFGDEICIDETTKVKYHAFPTLKQFKSKATDSMLRELGFGYRAPYIISTLSTIESKGGEDWLRNMRGKPLSTVREELTQLKGVGRKVADCIALFSMDCPETIPVDTHVFQIAKRFGFLKGAKSSQTLNDALYVKITDAFQDKYGDKAGWAHQILFAGDLTSFKDQVSPSKSQQNTQSTTKEDPEKAQVGKKRTVEEMTQDQEGQGRITRSGQSAKRKKTS